MKKSVNELLEEQLEVLCEVNKKLTNIVTKKATCDSIARVHKTVNDSIVSISEILLR
jgi:hypothetical protein